ncbi:hypothetical protein BaRGS_00000078 [Batillaria attramentaria]|uniref:Uncharacterized protein n=1 Tax=Batillaria attramentaria TaxID=370345 RepID=A0ABD0MB21_9CAEN
MVIPHSHSFSCCTVDMWTFQIPVVDVLTLPVPVAGQACPSVGSKVMERSPCGCSFLEEKNNKTTEIPVPFALVSAVCA